MGQAPGGYRQDTGCGEGRREVLGGSGELESAAPAGEETGLISVVIRHCGRALSQNVRLPGKARAGSAQGAVKVFSAGRWRLFRAGAGAFGGQVVLIVAASASGQFAVVANQ